MPKKGQLKFPFLADVYNLERTGVVYNGKKPIDSTDFERWRRRPHNSSLCDNIHKLQSYASKLTEKIYDKRILIQRMWFRPEHLSNIDANHPVVRRIRQKETTAIWRQIADLKLEKQRVARLLRKMRRAQLNIQEKHGRKYEEAMRSVLSRW